MYDRILMAVDHSDVAKRVINAARELASLSNGEVWVLHLREMETMSAPVSCRSSRMVKAHYEVRNTIYGQAGREIVDAAHAHDAGIIVMGSRGHSGMTGLVLGSTAHKVIHLSDRPVLVVR
jgi:nucleotide-binding universal stress UspA family protein